jgi:iron complex outermembrane receptor protein
VRSLQTIRGRAFKAALLTGGAGLSLAATPSLAQDVDCDLNPDDPACASTEQGPGIIVTGSRILRQDFEANSPFVTVDEALLENSSTAAIEQNLNKLPQFVPAQTPTMGGDIQPTATNTPGAATISLRGIGVNRNLVLIDGRRATPGNASGAVDITTIPAAAIERVEVISGGASATYGADAVAGVTNFILKKNFQGLELDGQVGMSQHGDGFEYQISGIMGADFDDGRGNISLALSTNKREANFQRDREWYRELWANPSTMPTQFFTQFPGLLFDGFLGGNPANLNAVFPDGRFSPFADGTTIYVDQNDNVFSNSAFIDFGVYGPPGQRYVNYFGYTGEVDNFDFKVPDTGVLGQNNTNLYLVLPLTRYNMFARGNYEINDWIGVFGQGTYSHVTTYTKNEPGPIFAGWGATFTPSNVDRDQLPDDLWTLIDSRPNPDGPVTMTALMPDPRETFTDVDTYSLTAGFEGSIPDSDWTWEAFAQFGESTTFARQTGVYSLERLRTVIAAPNFGKGFRAQGNPTQGGFGASTATCTSGLNFFRPPPGGFSEDCLEAIRADLKNRSKVQQNIWEANVTGSLFELPAGPLQAAIGASYREQDFEFLNDTLTTQGRSFLDQALGIYPSGNSFGSINVKEVYGELLVPILADTLINAFNLELGGRISDYNTTGTSYTYKALADLELTDWLRFRGGYNRAERAPNVAELFLAPQQTFGINTVGDLCSRGNPLSFSANPANSTGAQVEAVCRQLMDNTGDLNAKNVFYSGAQPTGTFGFAFPTTVGNPNLTPEKADTWTAGIVLRSPFTSPILSRLRLSVDWFDIKVDDAIGVQSVAVALRQCLDPGLNPLVTTDPVAAAASQFCLNVPRNTQNGGLGNVQVTYVNNGRFEVQGVDAQLDWGTDIGPGTVNLNVLFNYLIDMKSAELPTDPLIDYVGTFGTLQNGLQAGAYEYRAFTTLNYSVGPARIGLQWQHFPSVEDTSEAQFGPNATTGAPSYNLFALNGGYALTDNVNLRFGVENLFDKAPPLTGINTANTDPMGTGNLPGGTLGNGLSGGVYDLQGRRFYLGANLKF